MVGTQQQRKGRWTKEEDKMLNDFVATNNANGEDIDWSILEQEFNGTRDSKQIRERWVNHLNPSIKKRKFSEDEKQIIEEECSKHKFKWARIARKIPNATPLMIKNYYNNRLKKKNPANRRPSNSSTAPYNTTTYTINNFNNVTTTTTITTPNIINTNLDNLNNNSNHNHNHDYNNEYSEYSSTNDICYYNESNLSRSSSNRTDTTVNPGLSRNSSTRTNNSSITTVEPASPTSPHPPSLETCDEKLTTLAKVADFVSHVELPSPTEPPAKSKIMSIASLLI